MIRYPHNQQIHERKLMLIQSHLLFRYNGEMYQVSTDLKTYTKLMLPEQYDCNILLQTGNKPISLDNHKFNLQLFGENKVNMPIKSAGILFLREFLHPIYIFQLYSVAVWIYFIKYYIAAGMVLFLTIFSISINTILLFISQKKLLNIAIKQTNVDVLIDSNTISLPSNNIAPGDLLHLYVNSIVPCDCIILQGSCYAEESFLTGEPFPVYKSQIQPNGNYNYDTCNQNTLLSGSSIVSIQGDEVMVYALKTGSYTKYGQQISPTFQTKRKYGKIYYQYIYIICFLTFLGFISYFSVLSRLKLLRQAGGKSAYMHLFVALTIAVSPLFPSSMSLVALFSMLSLKKKRIYTIDPMRISIAGHITHIFFDKTGTLTSSSMVGHCYVSEIRNSKHSISEYSVEFVNNYFEEEKFLHIGNSFFLTFKKITEAMASTHTVLFEKNTLIGDPLEIEMLRISGWKFDDHYSKERYVHLMYNPSHINWRVATLQVFSFESTLKRMSVIAHSLSSNQYTVFTKGSYDSICSICDPNTIPKTADFITQTFCLSGHKLIALAYKIIDKPNIKREEAESNMIFLGLITFACNALNESKVAISELKSSNMNSIMLTGDNIETSVKVGYDCSIIESNDAIFVGKYIEGLVWGKYLGEDLVPIIDAADLNK